MAKHLTPEANASYLVRLYTRHEGVKVKRICWESGITPQRGFYINKVYLREHDIDHRLRGLREELLYERRIDSNRQHSIAMAITNEIGLSLVLAWISGIRSVSARGVY